METPWQFFVLIAAACLTVPLAVMIWRNWDMPSARPLAAALVLCSGWCLVAALEIWSTTLSEKILLFRIRLSFLPFIPPLMLEAYYRYAKGRKLLVGWKLPLLLLIPVVSAILVWFPGRLFAYDFRVVDVGSFTALVFSRGPANIIYYTYCTAVGIYAITLMVVTWRHSPPWVRRGNLLFAIIYLLPGLNDFLFVTGWSPSPAFNYTPLIMAISTPLLAWILFGERLLNLGPAARSVLMEHLRERLLVVDSTHHVIDANAAAAQWLGTTPDKLFGRPAAEVLFDSPDVLALLQGGLVENQEVALGGCTGAWEGSVYPIPAGGRPHARIVLLRDVSDRKRIEAELLRSKEAAESSNQAKGAFLAMMSHEIRTPMGGVIGFAQLLEQTPLNPEQREYVQMILSSGQSQLRIINDILDYSKVEAGRMELEERPFPLSATIAQSCLLLLPEARKKAITLQWNLAPDLPAMVEGDSLRLGQILNNLIGNAIKFTAAGGVTVSVRSEPKGGGLCRIRIGVVDTGIGIAPEALPRLFQSFSQVESSTARRYGGTGLGLAIAQRLCRLMGGDLTVESREGHGSTFTAEVHLRITGPASVGTHPARNVPNPVGPSLEILVVDDNPINRRLAQAVFRKMGHQATLCGDGPSALELLKTHRFDAVFMDVEMPGMDGLETVGEIRRREHSGEIPRRNLIVALTAHAIAGDRERCLAAGMDDYVTKPLHFTDLQAALKKCRQPKESPGGGGHTQTAGPEQ